MILSPHEVAGEFDYRGEIVRVLVCSRGFFPPRFSPKRCSVGDSAAIVACNCREKSNYLSGLMYT